MTRLSNWKEESDLFEVVTGKMTDKEALKKVDEKKGIKNKVIINPKLTEAIKELGGELIEATEEDGNVNPADEAKKKSEEQKKKQIENKQKRAQMIKKQVLMKKLIAVRQGSEDIVASHQPKGEVLDERLGGKGYSRKAAASSVYPGKKGTGDWEDSDRGAGNKAKKRAGGKVEKKSPTYLAHVHNKEEVQVDEAKVDKGRSDYGKASIRNYRRSGPGHGEPAMFDPENKRGKLIDKRREEHKARRGVKGAKVPAYKVEHHQKDKDGNTIPHENLNELNRYGKETGKATGSMNKKSGTPVKKGGSTDKALNIVRGMIRKQQGRPEGQQKKVKGLKSDAGTGKYLSKQQDKKDYAAKAKKAGFKDTQSYTDTVARYGGESNYKAGRGLGT